MRSILPSSVDEVRRPALGVAAGAAVAHADVQQAVGAERQVAAVVVGVRLVDLEDDPRQVAGANVPSAATGYSAITVSPSLSV